MSAGFTLLEVVVALVVLAVAVLAAAGTLEVASRTLAEAERTERAVLEADGVLDSLAGVAGAASGSRPFAGGDVTWSLDAEGVVLLRAESPDGGLLVEVTSAVALR